MWYIPSLSSLSNQCRYGSICMCKLEPLRRSVVGCSRREVLEMRRLKIWFVNPAGINPDDRLPGCTCGYLVEEKMKVGPRGNEKNQIMGHVGLGPSTTHSRLGSRGLNTIIAGVFPVLPSIEISGQVLVARFQRHSAALSATGCLE